MRSYIKRFLPAIFKFGSASRCDAGSSRRSPLNTLLFRYPDYGRAVERAAIWASDFARSNPNADLGVHLTLTSEWDRYKWGPVLDANSVPSLVDGRGYLWPDVPQVFSHDRLDEAEDELRAQIDKALGAGIDVSHLDSRMGPLHPRRLS